ncbi:MAG: cation diffusion facilitator family transporter [Balneolales bacterium]|nr:cation diffusion facilitator family transporter [Balneolales bacterium]
MAHNHKHHPGIDDSSIGKLWFSIFLNLAITIAQVIGGILSNSLALLSDAVHNLNDTLSLGISLFARKIGKKGVNASKTFGYKRAEIIGAFINLITLVIVALFLIKEGIERFLDPQAIDGLTMFWVAIIGLAGNVITAALLFKESKENLNMKSAYIHILSDALSSVGVIIGGWLIYQYQWYMIDTFLTVLIGGYILWHSYHMLKETIDILMQSKPENLDAEALTRAMNEIPEVCGVHHLHIWQLDESQTMLECHVVIEKEDVYKMEEVKNALKKILHDNFEIAHSTLEFEFEPCDAHDHELKHYH